MARQATCGAGLAHNAAVPAKLADVAGTLARNLDAHIPALDLGDPDAAREYDVYERLGDRLDDDRAMLAAVREAVGGAGEG